VRRLSALTITAGDTRVNADDPDRPARTASLTTRPSDESTFVVRKSVRRIWSRWLNRPAASSDPNGPTPAARMPMKAAMIRMNAPIAYMPPRAVRYQLTCGAALRAIVWIAPWVAVLGVPPGVNVGVAAIARRVTRWTYPVHKTTGSPKPITRSAPGNTQSGSPMTIVAALARIATATNAAAESPV